MSLFGMRASQMVEPSRALRGRDEAMPVPERHAVLGTPLAPPYPAGTEIAEFALGCFWGEERTFWQTPGVVSTSVGYEGGYTPNPTYEEVCSGKTGHAETVRVVYDLANGMELMVDETAPPELQQRAQSQSEALNLICEWLHAHRTG